MTQKINKLRMIKTATKYQAEKTVLVCFAFAAIRNSNF